MANTIDHSYTLLRNAWQRDRLAHAFMLTGADKGALRELASKIVGMVNGPREVAGTELFADPPVAMDRRLEDWQGTYVRILEPRSKSRVIRVDEMREMEELFYQAAPANVWKVGVIIDADRMNEAACNAFLKTLEEPPNNSLLLLLTSQPDAMLPTILSRCVEVPLYVPDQTVADRYPAWVIQAIDSISALLADGLGEVSVALGVRGIFAEALANRKIEIIAGHEADQKAEVLHYKKATDGKWLKDREDYYKALIEADYQTERSKLIDAMLSLMGDIARANAGSKERDFPNHAETTSQAAEGQSIPGILRRFEAMKQLKWRAENTNAQEALSLDVAFLDAFA